MIFLRTPRGSSVCPTNIIISTLSSRFANLLYRIRNSSMYEAPVIVDFIMHNVEEEATLARPTSSTLLLTHFSRVKTRCCTSNLRCLRLSNLKSDRSPSSIRGLMADGIRRIAWKNDFSCYVTSQIIFGDRCVKASACSWIARIKVL